MKFLIAVSFLMLIFCEGFAQNTVIKKQTDTLSWFEKNMAIGQSMESLTDGKDDPAQFQITFPDKKNANSYLVNVGVSVLIYQSNYYQGKLTSEYHRNTSLSKPQNNFQAGYSYYWIFAPPKTETAAAHYLQGDLKYVYDGIDIKNSFAANFLYTFRTDQSPFLNINAANFINDKNKRYTLFLSPLFGAQLQDVFAAQKDSSKGFILRPLYTLYGSITLNKKPKAGDEPSQPQPLVTFFTSYTGRWDLINTTNYSEGYTNLLKMEADYFILTKPLKLSIGASFNDGSDPLAGLQQQQYWLLSLNIFKAIP